MGETFGPYRLGELLGRGGMGTVHRAHDTRRERTVALKRLNDGLAGDPGYRERFRRECRLAARLSSPHVVPIHDFGEIDGVLFLDMRLVDGRGLDTVLLDGALTPDRAVRTVEQVAHALDAAHIAGLVHRDVKPSNVLVGEPDGFVHLADFGIARSLAPGTRSALTGTGAAPGTLAYLAPEVFAGTTADHRADVYALACVLFEALTGRRPFDGEAAQLMYHHLQMPPPDPAEVSPGVPAALGDVVRRGMAKDPDARPGSAGELARAARQALASGPAAGGVSGGHGPGGTLAGPAGRPPADPTVPGPEVPPGGRPRRRGVGTVIAVSVVVAVLVGGVGGAVAVSLYGGPGDTTAAAAPAAGDTTALRLAFPEIGRAPCTPAPPLTTSAGQPTQAVLSCDYPGTRARVEFLQWATPSDAALAVRDAGAGRVSYESEWKIQLVPQGPVFLGEDGSGGWLAVGAYRDNRYGFRVRAPSRQDLSATFPGLQFLTADQVPS